MDIFNPTTGEILKIPSTDLSGYVPYTGATSDVDLGVKFLQVGGIKDSAGTPKLSIDSNARKLYALNGTSVQLDYSLAGSLSAGGAGTPVNNSIFIGSNTGLGATNAINSFFSGISAGEGATDANNAVFVGGFSGYGASYAQNSNFFGYQAGYLADSAEGSNFFGSLTGQSAYNAYYSNFFGYTTGTLATNAIQSNFFGTFTGYQATNAKNTIFIGSYTGYQDTVNNLTSGYWSTAIGPYTGTGGFSNSMVFGRGSTNSNNQQSNFGNVLFLNGIYNSDTQSSIPVVGTATISASSTDIGSIGSLGAEKLTNGTFTGSASSWTLGTGWSYSTNTVQKSADGTGTLSQAVGSMATQFVVGEMYYITFTTSSHTVGSFTPTVGGVTLPTIGLTNANKTFGYIFTAISNTALTFTPSNTSRFYLDNISIKKITGGNLNVAGTANIGGASIMDAGNIAVGSTTGTKIGTATTQKIGLWNATPIVQPTTAVTAATFVANTSGIVNDTATFDGYTIGQVVKALRNAGILA